MPLKLAADCCKSILPYVAPKLASIEVESPLRPEIRGVEVATGITRAPGSAMGDETAPCRSESSSLEAAYEELGL